MCSSAVPMYTVLGQHSLLGRLVVIVGAGYRRCRLPCYRPAVECQ